MNLDKTKKSLNDFARRNNVVRTPDEVVEILKSILPICGDYSLSRQNALKLGIILVSQRKPQVIAPVCPDYSHKDGKYDFCSLGSGVPLLAMLHKEFIIKLPGDIFDVSFLLANQEALDKRLQVVVKLSSSEFEQKLSMSRIAIGELVAARGWQCKNMTDYFPDLVMREEQVKSELTLTQKDELKLDTLTRMAMYSRLGVFSFDEGFDRTLRTAAQYIALARCAQEKSVIVLNHSTINLRQYKREGVALLHNPVTVY